MIRVFVTKAFDRFARKQDIRDSTLIARVDDAERGLIDARLIGYLIKLRVARENEGESGGFRTVVAFIEKEKAYLFGFSKNDRGNINRDEEIELNATGDYFLGLNENQLAYAIENGEVRKIDRVANMATNQKMDDTDTVREARATYGSSRLENGVIAVEGDAPIDGNKGHKRRYRSKILEVVHETMSGLHSIGLVDNSTMRSFDESCLTSKSAFLPEDVVALRERENASQAVLAKYLGVSTNTVGQWERGERKPTGAALKLLSLAKAKGLDYIK